MDRCVSFLSPQLPSEASVHFPQRGETVQRSNGGLITQLEVGIAGFELRTLGTSGCQHHLPFPLVCQGLVAAEGPGPSSMPSASVSGFCDSFQLCSAEPGVCVLGLDSEHLGGVMDHRAVLYHPPLQGAQRRHLAACKLGRASWRRGLLSSSLVGKRRIKWRGRIRRRRRRGPP